MQMVRPGNFAAGGRVSRFVWRVLLGLTLASAAAWAQTPTVASVQNIFDFSSNLCPGVLVAIYGTNFGSTASAVSMTVGGKPGFIVAVTPSQINAPIPFEVSPGNTTIVVTVSGTPSAPLAITLAAVAPAFFTVDGSGSGSTLITNAAGVPFTSPAPAQPGGVVVAYLTGLGATNPPTPTGVAPGVLATPMATPTLMVGGQAVPIIAAAVSPGSAGLYQVNFKVPPGVQGATPIVLSIGGKTTSAQNPNNPITIPIFGISAIVNNASYGSSGTTSAGTIVSLYGNGFGTTSQTTGFPATTFQGVSVTFNGTAAPLFALSVTASTSTSIGVSQINLLVPDELPATGTVQVAVKTSAATSPNFPLTLAAGAPGMYYIADPSTQGRFNILAQFNQTAWLNMPASMATALKLPTGCAANNISPLSLCGQPAAPGDVIVLYATGLGLATPNGDPNGKPLPTGTVPPADGSVLYETVATPSITVGGFPVKPIFSGLAPGFPGLYQIDFQAPTGVTGDDVPVVLGISGSATDKRTMSIQPKAQ